MSAAPKLVLFDVFETLLRLDPLRGRFAEVGRPEHELDLFFLRTLRDGMAMSLAGAAAPFAEVARAALRTTSGHTLDNAAIDHVLAGFAELPVHEDVAPAFTLLAEAGVPAYAFTHGSEAVARSALDGAGVLPMLRGVLSAESISSFKPPAKVYHWACGQAGSLPEQTALVAVHSFDTHGAVSAGLIAGLATRLEGQLSEVVARPQVVAERLDDVVRGLLALTD